MMDNQFRGKKKSIIAILLAIAMLFGLFTQTVFAEGSTTHYLAFTSDVHGNTSNLTTWLNNLKSRGVTTLEYMVYGGDYSDYSATNLAAGPLACVTVVNNVYSGTPCALAKGNHDTAGIYDSGLVYCGSDYAVYVVDVVADGSTAAYSTSEIEKLDVALDSLNSSIPVFIAVHFPIHYYGGRTTTNAEAMLEMLNDHPNAVMLWGHNHSVNDPGYGTVKFAGGTLICTSGGASHTINFTDANFGCMGYGTNDAYGMLATITKNESGINVEFSYINMSSNVVSSYSMLLTDSGTVTNINDVAVTVTAPRSGNVPNLAGTVTGGPFTGSACTVSWDPADNPFVYDTAYTASVTLTAPSGYAFASDAAATINGHAATAVLNGDELTVTYQFAAISESAGTYYEYAETVENGSTYLIAAKTGSDYYALTTEKFTVSTTDYLKGTKVTVSDDIVTDDGVSDNMLWVLATDGNGYDVTNGSDYLNRKSGSASIYVSTTEGAASYSDWIYNGTSHRFYTYSSSGSTNMYLYMTSNSGTYYMANSSSTIGEIYLFKMVEGTPAEVIGSVEVEGIDAPVVGNIPDLTAAVSTTGVADVSGVMWSPAAAAFEYSTAYTASVTLTAESGYKFTSDSTATVNGQQATAVLNSDGTLTAAYTFPATQANPYISYELVTGVESESVYVVTYKSSSSGTYYALTNTSTGTNYLVATAVDVAGEAVTSTVESDMLWTFTTAPNTSGAFDVTSNSAGTDQYLLRLSSTTSGGGGYLTTDETDSGDGYSDWKYVNGTGGSQLYLTSGSASKYYLTRTSGTGFGVSTTSNTAIYLFKLIDSTPSTQQISSVAVTNIDQPTAENTPDTSAATATVGVTVSAVTWAPSVSTFGYNTQYTASVILTAQSGYEFASGASATIDGQTAAVTDNGDGTLTASYQFPATANQQIGSVAITDITAPVAGATPDTTATVSTTGVTASEVTWAPSAATFGYNTVYTATVTLTAQSGYTFASGATVKIDGQTATVVDNGDGTLSASYQFPATANHQISSITVTDIDTPAAEETPDTAADTSTAGVTVSAVLWTPNVSTFGYNTQYTASVTLTPLTGYEFTSGASVTIDGNDAVVVHNGDGTLTASYRFTATAKGVISSVTVAGIKQPIAGKLPDTDATTGTTGVTAGTVTWNPAESPFGYDTVYTASVTLTAEDDYEFASTVSVTVNGGAAVQLTPSGGTLTVSHTFDATAILVDSIAITGITPPAANGTPDIDAEVSTAGVTAGAVTWNPTDSPFGYNKIYTANFTLTAQAGYVFGTSVSVTVNGGEAVQFTPSESTVAVAYTFPTTEKQQISSVEVTDIDIPAATATPDTSASVQTTGVTAGTVTWDPDDTLFGYNTAYTAGVTVTPGADYEFTVGATATLNGNPATAVLNGDGTLTVTYTFPRTVDSIGATLGISGPSGLLPGESGEYTVSAVLDNAAAVQATLTYDSDFFELISGNLTGEVDYDTNRSTTITLITVVLRCKATVSASGILSLSSVTAGRLTGDEPVAVSCTFDPLTVICPEPISNAAVIDITAPVAGATPDTAATVTTTGVAASAVTWLPSVLSFGYNTPYTASVTLTAEAGYKFTAGATATIDEENAIAVLNGDGTLTVTYTFAATGKEPIANAAIAGIQIPLAGSAPDTDATTATAGVTVSAVTWDPDVAEFGYNTIYTASVTLTAGAGYMFTSGTTATVNGTDATGVTLNGDGTLTVTYAFPETVNEPIASVEIAEIDVPLAGGIPDTVATVTTANVTAGAVTWTPEDSPFGYNTVYMAHITLTAGSGYAFASDTAALVNSNAAIAVLNGDGTLTVTYTFAATGKEPIASAAIAGIQIPLAGSAPDTDATTATAGVTVSAVTWDPDVAEFGYNTSYTASVTLTAGAGYMFTSGTVATVNGTDATGVTLNGDGTLTVTFAFDSTGEEPISGVAITDIAVPAAGGTPDTTATVTTANVTAGAVSWFPDDTAFDYNTAYTANVTLTAGTGYKFTSGTTATVNSNSATAVKNSDGTLTVTYTFEGTEMETPDITAQPQGLTTVQSGTASLSVTAEVEKGVLSYQWYSNTADSNTSGAVIAGATLSSYSVPTETTGTTYYYCVVTNSDNAGLGSTAASRTSQTASVTVKLSSIQSSVYTVDTANDLLLMVSVGTSADQLKAKLLNDAADIKIFSGETEYTGDAVATGMTVKYYVNGVVIDELTISVFGDPSGDGEIDITDILYLRAQIIGTYTMTGCEGAASDINGDGVIDILDILYIRAHIIGTYVITAQ